MIEIDLAGSVVAITGAAGGIGTGIAERFAEAGASLVLHHHRSDPPTSKADHVVVQLDVTDRTAPERLIAAAVDRFGKLDALVNNAAVQPQTDFVTMTDAEWSEMMDVNVTACHRLTQAFARHVIGRDETGSVVHISSIEGTQPAAGHSHYGVSKAAILMHTKVAALELGHLGVRVNAVSPGLIWREGIDEAWPEGVGRWLDKAPLGQLGSPRDVGDACVFLCSDLARWITGANLVVDGGVSARSTW